MNQPHPDDEVLSASLDGDAGTEAEAHLHGCAVCRARRDALDGVRRAVAFAPPPPRAEVTERAVGAALAAWSAERNADAPVTPLAERRNWRRPPGWVLGAAAAVAAVLVAASMVTGGGDGDSAQQTASAPAHGAAADAGAEAEAASDRAPLDGGDLGEQSDQLALGEVLRRAVAPPAAAADMASPSGEAANREGAATADDGPRAAGAPAAGSRAPRAARPCTEVVGNTFGAGLGPLVYTASLRWQGAPAVLLAYRLADPAGPGPDHRAFVMAEDGCRLLVVQGF